MKFNHLWRRGSVSLILNPFLKVFSISAFLKVIHAPQTPKRGSELGTAKMDFLHSNSYILAFGTSHGPYKHPIIKGYLSKWWKSWEPGLSILGIFYMVLCGKFGFWVKMPKIDRLHCSQLGLKIMNLIFLRTVVSNKGQIGTNHKILYSQRLFCDRENASGYSGTQWV